MNAFLFTGNQLLILLESQALTLPPPTAIFYFYFFLPHWLRFINRKKVFPHLSSIQQLCSFKYGCSPVSVYISTWRGVTLSRCQTQTCIVSLILGRGCIVRLFFLCFSFNTHPPSTAHVCSHFSSPLLCSSDLWAFVWGLQAFGQVLRCLLDRPRWQRTSWPLQS